MQVETSQTPEALVREIHTAFEGVPLPSRVDDMLMPAYRGNEEAYALAAEFVGRPWQELPMRRLMFHREFLHCMSAAGYRSVLPAYLVGSVSDYPGAETMRGDLAGYMLTTMLPRPRRNKEDAVLAERLSLLDPAQRAAVANVLRYLVELWGSKEAAEILQEW